MTLTYQLPEIKSAINKKDYTLTTISPLAMHGAEPMKKAELRTASIKGVYRYWWRALQLESDAKKLLEEEVKLFGGTETDNKRKSPIIFALNKPLDGEKKINVLPHKQNKFWPKAIDKGNTIHFKIQILQHKGQQLSVYDQLLQFMFHLASFGQRARRGFGAFQWEKHSWQTPQQFVQSLRDSLKQLNVENQFEWNENSNCIAKRKSSVNVKHPVIKAIYIGTGKKEVDEVLELLGRASHEGNPFGNLGSAQKGRWASPLWCTVRKIGDKYYPIITEMYTSKEVFQKRGVKDFHYEKSLQAFLQVLGVKL